MHVPSTTTTTTLTSDAAWYNHVSFRLIGGERPTAVCVCAATLMHACTKVSRCSDLLVSITPPKSEIVMNKLNPKFGKKGVQKRRDRRRRAATKREQHVGTREPIVHIQPSFVLEQPACSARWPTAFQDDAQRLKPTHTAAQLASEASGAAPRTLVQGSDAVSPRRCGLIAEDGELLRAVKKHRAIQG